MGSEEAVKRLRVVRACAAALLVAALAMLVVVLAPAQAHAGSGEVHSSSVSSCSLNVYLTGPSGSTTKAASAYISGSWSGSKPSYKSLHSDKTSNGAYSVSVRSSSASGSGVTVSVPAQTCSTKKDYNKYQQIIIVKVQITAPAHYWAYKDSSSTVSNSYESARLNICEYQANGNYTRWTGSEIAHGANGMVTGTVKVQINVKNMGLLDFATNSKKTKFSSGSGSENIYLGQNRIYAKADLNGGRGGSDASAFFNGYSSSGAAYASSASSVPGKAFQCAATSTRGWASGFLPSQPPTRGHSFAGWAVSVANGSYSSCTPSSYTYDNKTTASASDVGRGPGSVGSTTLVFRALWSVKVVASHNVKYYLDGVLQSNLTATVKEGATYALAVVPAKSGYTVSGWYANASCAGVATSPYATKTMGGADVSWYAKSTIKTVVPTPTPAPAPDPDPDPEPGPDPDPTPAVPSTYTITYIVNPGTNAIKTSTVSVKEGAVYTVGAGAPSYSGTLVGWYGDSGCSGARTFPGANVTATSNKTWYAYTTHKVSFVVDPGTSGEETLELLGSVRYRQSVTLPVGSSVSARVTKPGCENWSSKVNAWFGDKGCTQKTSAFTVTGDAVVYTYNVASITYVLASYAKSLDAAEGGLHPLYSSPPTSSSAARDTMRAHLPFATKLFKYGSALKVEGDATLYWATSSGSARSIQSIEGAYVDDPGASGSAVTNLTITRNATLYKEYTQGIYDGVIGG